MNNTTKHTSGSIMGLFNTHEAKQRPLQVMQSAIRQWETSDKHFPRYMAEKLHESIEHALRFDPKKLEDRDYLRDTERALGWLIPNASDPLDIQKSFRETELYQHYTEAFHKPEHSKMQKRLQEIQEAVASYKALAPAKEPPSFAQNARKESIPPRKAAGSWRELFNLPLFQNKSAAKH